jgi:hypothetical protein
MNTMAPLGSTQRVTASRKAGALRLTGCVMTEVVGPISGPLLVNQHRGGNSRNEDGRLSRRAGQVAQDD